MREREGDISKGVPITARSTRLTFDEAAKDVVADYAVNGRRSKDDVERAEHEALQRQGTICPFVFHRRGRRIKSLRKAWADACAEGYPSKLVHDLRRSAVRNMTGTNRGDNRAVPDKQSA